MLLDHFEGGSLKHYPCQFKDVLGNVQPPSTTHNEPERSRRAILWPHRAGRALGVPSAPRPPIHVFGRPHPPRGAPRPHIHVFPRREARQTLATVVSSAPWKMMKCTKHCKNLWMAHRSFWPEGRNRITHGTLGAPIRPRSSKIASLLTFLKHF